MTVWFTSDPHWGHEFVAKTRGFDTAKEHDEWLFDVYSSFFAPDDVVWWLGDLAMKNHGSAIATCLGSGADSKHHLVAGNHDPVHPMHRLAFHEQWTYLRHGFESVQAFARRRVSVNGTRFDAMLSHFPYEGDHGVDRYPQYRLLDLGKPLIHGHTHSTEKVSFTRHNTLQVHVGIDAWRRPVKLEEVAAIIASNGVNTQKEALQ